MIVDHQSSFNGGQWGPYLWGRSDLDRYRTSFRDGVNLLVSPYGPAAKRPGTYYFAQTDDMTAKSRLITWQISAGVGYVLEMAPGKFRVIKDRVWVLDDGDPYEFAHPYLEAELFEVQFIQINDIGYFVHPNHHPMKLGRIADDNWTFTQIEWRYPPLRDLNITAITLTPAATSGTTTVTASAPLFNAGHVGSYFQISHERGAADYQVDLPIVANATSSEILIQGAYSFYTTGIWNADVTIQKYDTDAAAWVAFRNFSSDSDRNYQTTGDFPDMTRVRLTITNYGGKDNNPVAVLEAGEPLLDGLVKVTAVTNSTTATVEVVSRLAKTTATKIWREGAFSTFRGFARTVAIHDQRVIYGGTPTDRQTIWGSATDDYENFRPGVEDDESFKYTLASGAHDELEWMVSQKSLLIGTSGGEWVLSSGSDEAVITPTNARARRQSNYGSEYRQAVVVDDAAMFLRVGGEKLAQMSYYFERDGYASEDLTMLSYDVGRGGFQQIAYKRKRDPSIYAVTARGKLAVLSYNRGQEVTGWTQLETAGLVESVAVLARAGDEDEVWITVLREIDGDPVRYIERMDSDSWDKIETDDLANLCFVDSAIRYDGEATAVIEGLAHLEGATVKILADGSNHPPKLVVGGEVELDFEASTVVIGLPYECRLVPHPRAGGAGNGSLKGREFKMSELVFFFYKTISVKYGPRGAGNLTDVPFRQQGTDYGEPIPLFSGPLKVKCSGRHEIDAGIEIRSDEPFPFVLTGLVTKYNVEGN